jgi:hypothetical protein
MINRMSDRNDHIAAAIRGNIRDARIQEVLAQTDRARELLLADRLARIMQAHSAIGASITTLDVAADTVRRALHSFTTAAANSRETILDAAQEALVVLEVAAQDARATLEKESGVAELRTKEPLC